MKRINATRRLLVTALVTALVSIGSARGEDPNADPELLKASLNGKFKTLLKKIDIPRDEEEYSKFHDWGYWSGTKWAGHDDLPRGYWVYVAPSWYIWKADSKAGRGNGRLPIVKKTADRPAIVVRNVEEAAKLPPGVESLRVVMRRRDDHPTLVAALRHAPNIRRLNLDHPDGGVPLESIKLLAKFPKLEELFLEGDLGLDDQTVMELGKLNRLKSLRLRVP